jgi:hypothetical protein
MGALNPQTQLKIHHIGTSRVCENRDLATENVVQKREGEERWDTISYGQRHYSKSQILQEAMSLL